MVSRLVCVIVLVAIFITPVLASTKLQCRSDKGKTAYFINPTPGYDHDRYGTAPRDAMFEFAAFVASFDSDDDDTGDSKSDLLAVPEWVAYEIKRYGDGPTFSSPKPSPKRPTWYKMDQLAFLGQQQGVTKKKINDSYTGFGTGAGLTGFGVVNRGHLAMKAHAQRISWKAACNTHVFVNAVPQQRELNQGEWLDLEAYSGAAANKFGQVWVIAGPIFDDKASPRLMHHSKTIPVAVPDAMFKILIKETEGTRVPDVLAFIYKQPSNEYVMCSKAESEGHTYDHTKFLVSVADIEQKTGLKFLRNVKFKNAEKRKDFKTAKATALWPVGEDFYGVECVR